MKIQFLNGGLANQAFQYIFARYYELSHPGDCMYMDDTYFALNTVHNGYELEKVFGIRPRMLSECFDEEVWNYILDERRNGKSVPQILCENGIDTYMISEAGNSFQTFNPFQGRVVHVPCNEYHPDIQEAPGDVYYHGYWINKEWFARYQNVFLQEFCFPQIPDPQNQEIMERINKTNSVSIHIRRGDYVTCGFAFDNRVYQDCAKNFAQNAPGKWELFVFSDDIPWCREHREELGIQYFKDVTYIEGNVKGKNYLDLQLMSRCRAMILSNSAFCYLAALLNVDKQYYINPTARQL